MVDSRELLSKTIKHIDQDIPRVYWEQTGALNNLETVYTSARSKLEKMSNSTQNAFVDVLWYFMASSYALERIKNGKQKVSTPSTVDDVVKVAREFTAANRGEKEKLFRLLEAHIQCLGDDLPSPDSLHTANQRMIHDEQRAVQNKKSRRVIGIVSSIFAAVLLLGGGGWFVYQHFFKPPVVAEVLPTPIINTMIVEKIITATPEPTVVPTTVVLTPTSQFVSLSLQDVVPNPPYGLEPLFLIDDTAAIFEPEQGVSWTIADSGIGGTHHAIQEVDPLYSAAVSWTVDQPLLEDGRYELFVLDPVALAGGTDLLTYEVYTSNIDLVTYEVITSDNLMQPIIGTNSIAQETNYTQNVDEWVSIGIYDFNAGDKIRIRLAVPNKLVSPSYYLGVDAVLVSKLPTLDPVLIEPLQSPQVYDKNIICSVDDSQAQHDPADTWQWVDANPGNWGGVYIADIPADAAKVYTLLYDFEHPVYSGLYELWAWVPVDAVLSVDFTLDMKYIDTLGPVPSTAYSETITGIDPVTEGLQGKPVKITTFDLDKTATLQLTASSVTGQAGYFALDDVYLVLLPYPDDDTAE